MFEQEIINLGFIEDIKTSSYKLDFIFPENGFNPEWKLTFLYIESGGSIYYEYYGTNHKHSDCSRVKFIDLIHQCKSEQRNLKIDSVLNFK
jgi:hypothetical protein